MARPKARKTATTPVTEPTDVDALAAAQLAEQGALQKEIARYLGVSKATVSRALKRAVDKGWLETRPRLSRSVLESDDELRRKVEARVHASRLTDKLATLEGRPSDAPVCRVEVFPVVGAASDWDERAKRFSHAVAGRVHELIRSSTICGISWGITLYNIIKSIKFIASPGDPPVTFVGVCGESTRRQQSPHLSASYLAAEFDSAFNRPPGHAVGQGATPCSIPAAFSKNERFVISKFINNFTGWGDFRSRVRSMDMVLTSCGATAVKPDLLIEDWLLAQNLTSEELGRLAVGDVAGVLLPTEGNEADVAAINAHWLGLGQDDLADIARRASRTGASRASVPKPGVVLVATGENKADVALSAVRLGLVNKLIIDDELANKLAKLVGIPAGRD